MTAPTARAIADALNEQNTVGRAPWTVRDVEDWCDRLAVYRRHALSTGDAIRMMRDREQRIELDLIHSHSVRTGENRPIRGAFDRLADALSGTYDVFRSNQRTEGEME